MADVSELRFRSLEDRLYDEVKPRRNFAAGCRRRLLLVVRALKQFATFCLSQFGLIFGLTFKQFATFCLSQFGLILLVVSYSLIGAYIFGQLGEQTLRNQGTELNRDIVEPDD